MPAEANQHRPPVTVADIAGLVARFVGLDHVAPATPLAAVGLDDDLARFRVWQLAAEEHAERTVTELDDQDLLDADTVGELVVAIVGNLHHSGQTWLRPPAPGSTEP